MAGLYIHVPYCVQKCRYCDFYSVPLDSSIRHYLAALDKELSLLPADFFPNTVYVGGGTPTSLSAADLAELVGMIRRHVDVGRIVEWTCEANPGTLDRDKIECLRQAGVNRISLGVQSFDASSLAFLGRIHSGEDAVTSYRQLREAGFSNINLDLIFGIPGAAQDILERDLARAIALAPEHIAFYGLIFEDDTPLTRLRDDGKVVEVGDDEELAQYRLVRRTLRQAGYHHYEISNFAKPGFESRHNLQYWDGGEYIGCGPSAHSHWKGLRYGNSRNIGLYSEALLSGRSPRDFEERLDPEAKARETLVMGLRKLDGVSRESFLKTTGFDYEKLRGPEIRWLCEIGLLEEKDGFLRLTEKGIFISDSVFAELV